MDERRNDDASAPNLRTGLAVVAVLALVAVTGCVGDGEADVGRTIEVNAEPTQENVTGDEVFESAFESVEDIGTYRVESETRMDLASFFGVSMSMNTTGEFDRNESLAHATTEGEQGAELLGFSGGESFETEVYRTSDARYTRRSNESVTRDWETAETDEPLPPGLDDVSATVEGADASLEGVSEMDDKEAYVLSLDMSASRIGEAFSRTVEAHGTGRVGESDEGEDVSENSVNVSEAYLWVDRETRRPLRFAYLVNLDIEGDGENEASGSMEIFGDTRYTYDDDVEIEVPEEVRE
jgi:hypothetical protein